MSPQSLIRLCNLFRRNSVLTCSQGQTHRLDRYPSNHKRLQVARRHRLVWHGLLAHQRGVPAAFRKAVQVRSHQGYFSGFHPGIRGRLNCLRCGSKLDRVHHRQSDCGCRSWRRSFWRRESGIRNGCFLFNADVLCSRWLSWYSACRLSSVPGCKAWLVPSSVYPQYSVQLSVAPSPHMRLGDGVSGSIVSESGEANIVGTFRKTDKCRQ